MRRILTLYVSVLMMWSDCEALERVQTLFLAGGLKIEGFLGGIYQEKKQFRANVL